MKNIKFNAFKIYLIAKGYNPYQITETETGMEALLYKNKPPLLKDFTQVKITPTRNFYWVRLSKSDYNNILITDNLYPLND